MFLRREAINFSFFCLSWYLDLWTFRADIFPSFEGWRCWDFLQVARNALLAYFSTCSPCEKSRQCFRSLQISHGVSTYTSLKGLRRKSLMSHPWSYPRSKSSQFLARLLRRHFLHLPHHRLKQKIYPSLTSWYLLLHECYTNVLWLVFPQLNFLFSALRKPYAMHSKSTMLKAIAFFVQ